MGVAPSVRRSVIISRRRDFPALDCYDALRIVVGLFTAAELGEAAESGEASE
jgi:hypothetical protein